MSGSRSCQHERRLALHEVALRNRGLVGIAVATVAAGAFMPVLSSTHARRALLPAALDDR